MKTILIPIDFTDTAQATARYGAAFAHAIGATKIILYNAYAIPVSTDFSMPAMESVPYVDPNELKQISEEGLASNKEWLVPFANGLEVETFSEMGMLDYTINEAATNLNADIIIVGIAEAGKLEQMLVGSNALTVVRNTHVPVLIVPTGTAWKPIEQIGWACDCKNVEATTPLHTIEELLHITHANLHVIHNNLDQAFNEKVIQENKHIQDFFKNESYQFALVENKDTATAIREYVVTNNIDLLIMVPKKHSWWESIFSSSTTEDLAFHTHVPLLCLQQ